MARTSSVLVRGIMQGSDVPDTVDLGPYIDSASLLVTGKLSLLGYSGPELEMIERWLSAHLYEVDNPRIRKEVIGGYQKGEDSYESRIGLGLDLTRFGQQVKMLDYLNGLTKRIKMDIIWLGEPLC